MKDKLKKVSMAVIPVSTALLSGTAFAAEGSGTAEAISQSISTIANDITTTIGKIAPVAMGVVGLFLAWRYGMKFFKSVSK